MLTSEHGHPFTYPFNHSAFGGKERGRDGARILHVQDQIIYLRDKLLSGLFVGTFYFSV